jgi:hypothetical protein
MTRRRHLVLLGIAAALAATTAAWAYWTADGSGAASASAATLGAPTAVGASTTAGSPTVQLAWTGSALSTGQSPSGYYATRIRTGDGASAAACGTSPSALTAATGCTDQDVPDGTYHYVVTAVYRTWTARSTDSDDVSVARDTTAPTGSITVPAGTVGGTVAVTSDSADAGSGVASAQFQLAPHGGAFADLGAADTASPYQVSWDTTTVANGQYDLRVTTTDNADNSATSSIVTVTVANSFQVTVSSPQAAGSAFGVTITARANGATNTAYGGTRTVSFGGPGTAPDGTHAPAYPSSVTFSGGVGSASVTLFKAESPALTATSGNLSGTSAAFTVNGAAAASLSLAAASTTPTAGATDDLTITAKDAYGNTADGYTGSRSLTFGGAGTVGSFRPTVTNSSGSAVDFGSTTVVSFSSGVASVSGGSNGAMRLYKAEAASLSVSDGTVGNASGLPVTVSPATASQFAVSAGATQTAGSAFGVTSLTARDPYGNTATGYTGGHTVTWSGASTSPGGTAPSYPTSSVSFSNGVSTTSLTATLFAAGSNNLTASASGPAVSGGATIAVGAGTSKGLGFTAQTVTGGGASETCNAASTSCTITGLPKNGAGTWTARVGVVDTWGNPTVASGAVTVTITRSQSKGNVSPSSLTIASGATVSSSSFTYTTGSGGYTENVTAGGSGGGVSNSAVTSVTTT